jgi:hypothetical protein
MQPQQRVVRCRRGEFEKAVLGSHGYTALLLPQLTSRETGLGRQWRHVDPIFFQVA